MTRALGVALALVVLPLALVFVFWCGGEES